MKIKIKACFFPYLETQIENYKLYGYVLLEIRPAKWWEFPAYHVAIMKKND